MVWLPTGHHKQKKCKILLLARPLIGLGPPGGHHGLVCVYIIAHICYEE